jgi:hypothetical protein
MPPLQYHFIDWYYIPVLERGSFHYTLKSKHVIVQAMIEARVYQTEDKHARRKYHTGLSQDRDHFTNADTATAPYQGAVSS